MEVVRKKSSLNPDQFAEPQDPLDKIANLIGSWLIKNNLPVFNENISDQLGAYERRPTDLPNAYPVQGVPKHILRWATSKGKAELIITHTRLALVVARPKKGDPKKRLERVESFTRAFVLRDWPDKKIEYRIRCGLELINDSVQEDGDNHTSSDV